MDEEDVFILIKRSVVSSWVKDLNSYYMMISFITNRDKALLYMMMRKSSSRYPGRYIYAYIIGHVSYKRDGDTHCFFIDFDKISFSNIRPGMIDGFTKIINESLEETLLDYIKKHKKFPETILCIGYMHGCYRLILNDISWEYIITPYSARFGIEEMDTKDQRILMKLMLSSTNKPIETSSLMRIFNRKELPKDLTDMLITLDELLKRIITMLKIYTYSK